MLKRSLSYAVELDGQLALYKEGALETLSALNSIKGDCRVVSDFENVIARTMTVEADPRYVELMISRKLQETGEFDEPVTVIAHWKKKRSRNTTDIFFSALPSKRYFQYLELVSEHKDNLILLPLQSVLMAMLKKYGKDRPVAAVLQHGRYADLLIGTRRKIWFADRVVAFDTSDEQIGTLWETVRADIDLAGQDNHQTIDKMVVASWVNSGPLPQWSDEAAPEVICLKEQVMVQDGREVKASLPGMMDHVGVGQAVAMAKDKLFYRAGRVLPVLNTLFIVLALFLATCGGWYQHRSAGWEAQIQKSIQAAEAIQSKMPKPIQALAFESALAFIERLWSSRKLPTYGQILSDLSQGKQMLLVLENIKADYSEDKVAVKAYGTARAPFEVAYKAYQALQRQLVQRGYTVTEDRFDTQINVSNFVLQFNKEVR
jgi:hypothetical protein